MRKHLIKTITLSVFILFTFLPANAQKYINYSGNTVEYAKSIAPDAVRILGNAKFIDRRSATMYCDSAYYYQNSENIDAFGNVRIVPDQKGNTSLTGNILHYTAADRVATITGDVVLINDSAKLTTQNILYNMTTGVATYPGKGTIVNGKTTIVSDHGAYDKYKKEAYFKKNVVVTNPQYVIHTDTMNYNTTTEIVVFLGPTFLNSTDNKDSIYCEKGWHNTKKDISLFRQKAWIKSGSNIMKGDTLYYEKLTGEGKAYGHIEMRDTTQSSILRGNYAIYNRPKKIGIITKRALMIQVDKKDSLYLHGDTLSYGTFTEFKDSLSKVPDTFNFVKAFHHVKFFRADLQGKADSLFYSFKDSTLQFFGEPILWAEENQLTSEFIKIFIKNKKIDKMEMTNNSFAISQQDSGRFNQMKGRNMFGFFANNELRKLYVKGNGQMIFFHKDQDEIMGIQKTESSDILIYFKKNEKTGKPALDKVKYINDVQGTFNPPLELKGGDLKLKDFIWLIKYRPKIWTDIFIW
jgi:lipopolysaccharide export system protein LptA